MSTLSKICHDRVRAGDIHADPAQEAGLQILEDIRHHLETARQKKRGILGGLFHKPEETPMGLYLWGADALAPVAAQFAKDVRRDCQVVFDGTQERGRVLVSGSQLVRMVSPKIEGIGSSVAAGTG